MILSVMLVSHAVTRVNDPPATLLPPHQPLWVSLAAQGSVNPKRQSMHYYKTGFVLGNFAHLLATVSLLTTLLWLR